MKNIFNYALFVILLLFIFVINVNAECSYQERKELLNEAKAVDIGINIKEIEKIETGINTYGEEVSIPSINYEFTFLISNLSDNLFIKYYNNLNYEENYISKEEMQDGIFTFVDTNYTSLYTYYFEIYSSNENCLGDKMYTKKITKPIYNGYSKYSICSEEELKDYKYCKKFVNEKIQIDESKFIELANKELNSFEIEESDSKFSFIDFIKNYYIYIVLFIVVSITASIIFFIRKKKSEL